MNQVRIMARIAVGGFVGLAALLGSSAAHADTRQEKEQGVCDALDDPTGQQLGYTPEQYAFMVLRMSYQSLSPTEAIGIMRDAVRDYCPEHAADLTH